MDSVRILPRDTISLLVPCCRCDKADRPWDRMAGKAFCPNCQEALVVGEAPPLIERTQRNRCAVCDTLGTITFLTFPLQGTAPLAIDLCPEHLRCLVGRRLGPHAFHQLRRRLQNVGLECEEIFLLHGAFYDTQGRAIQPATEVS